MVPASRPGPAPPDDPVRRWPPPRHPEDSFSAFHVEPSAPPRRLEPADRSTSGPHRRRAHRGSGFEARPTAGRRGRRPRSALYASADGFTRPRAAGFRHSAPRGPGKIVRFRGNPPGFGRARSVTLPAPSVTLLEGEPPWPGAGRRAKTPCCGSPPRCRRGPGTCRAAGRAATGRTRGGTRRSPTGSGYGPQDLVFQPLLEMVGQVVKPLPVYLVALVYADDLERPA